LPGTATTVASVDEALDVGVVEASNCPLRRAIYVFI